MSFLLIVEQNSELLLKNHNSHPTGSTTMLEAHATSSQKGGKNRHGKNKYSGGNKNFAGNNNHGWSNRPQSKYKGKGKGKVKFNNTWKRNETENELSHHP